MTDLLCPACNKQIPSNARYCPHCGVSLGVENRRNLVSEQIPLPVDSSRMTQLVQCSSCAAKVSPTATFCAWCGGKFDNISDKTTKTPLTYCIRDLCYIAPHQKKCPVCEGDKSTVGAVCWSISELKALQLANIKTESAINPVVYCTKDFCIIEPYQSYCPQCGGHKNTVGAKANSVADIEAQIAANSNNEMSESQVSSASNVDQARFLKLVGICVLAIFLVWGIIKLSGNNNDSYNSTYITSADATVLGQSISNEINVDAVNRLIAGGIAANTCDLSGTLQSFVDCIFGPIEGSVNSNDPITAAGEEVSAQPGGGLYITFTNLFPDNTWAQAALDEFVADAAAAESAGKTYQDYQG